jgi:hypothetical protein
MKTNRQTHIFARQVQVDLLALPDADLFQTVHRWVSGRPSGGASEETLSALGYAHGGADPHTRSLSTPPGSEGEGGWQWFAPAPQRLRGLLTDMDVPHFTYHVLPLAFQALHLAHPEWGEGATFNAHLANYLRSIGMKR